MAVLGLFIPGLSYCNMASAAQENERQNIRSAKPSKNKHPSELTKRPLLAK